MVCRSGRRLDGKCVCECERGRATSGQCHVLHRLQWDGQFHVDVAITSELPADRAQFVDFPGEHGHVWRL